MSGLRLQRAAVVRGASQADRGAGRWESVRAAVPRVLRDQAVIRVAVRQGPAVTLVVRRGRAAIPVVRRDRVVIRAGRRDLVVRWVSRELLGLRLLTWVRCNEILRPIS